MSEHEAAGSGQADELTETTWRDDLWNRLSDFTAQHGFHIDSMGDEEHDELLNDFIDGLERDILPRVCPTLPDRRAHYDTALRDAREDVARAMCGDEMWDGDKAVPVLADLYRRHADRAVDIIAARLGVPTHGQGGAG